MKKYSLMSYEEYANISHPKPYIFELKSDKKHLVYFGSRHLTDPSDPMFEQIRKYIKDLKPELTLVEGSTRLNTSEKESFLKQIVEQDVQSVIKSRGEIGFVIREAFLENSNITSGEQSTEVEADHLLSKGFTKDELFLYYLVRQTRQWITMREKPELEIYLQGMINNLKSKLKWNAFDFSLEYFSKLHKNLYQVDIQKDDREFYKHAIDPVPWDKTHGKSIIRMISHELAVFRDISVVKAIEDALEKYNRIFVIYGSTHAVIEEKTIREIFERYS